MLLPPKLVESRTRRLLLPSVCVALALASSLTLVSPSTAQGLTFVDANDGFVGTQNLFPTSALEPFTAAPDELWGFRDAFGAEGPGGRFIWESGGTGSGVEDSPELFQTISGLAPSVMYDIYAVYWSSTSQNWTIRTGTTSGNLTLYDRTGSIAGATAGIPANSAIWSAPPTSGGVPIFSEGDRTMLLGYAGTVAANGSGQVTAYIDDLPNTGFGDRSWLDGLAYVPSGTSFSLTATIDTSTGQLTLANNTGTSFSFSELSITSSAGSLDASSWLSITNNYDNGTLDTDPWEIVSPAGAPNFSSELNEIETSGGAGGATLATGSSVSFGEVWNRTRFRDVELVLTLPGGAGTTVTVTPTYTGDGHQLGDFNNSGEVGLDDYAIFVSNLHADVSSLLPAEAYLRGDMNGDLVINHSDFVAFRDAFPGSLAEALAAVPEPSSLTMLLLVAFGVGARRRWRRQVTTIESPLSREESTPVTIRRVGIAVAIALGLVHSPASAQTYLDAGNSNTALADGSGNPWNAASTSTTDLLWGQRFTFGRNSAGVYGQPDSDIFEAREDTVGQLVTTITGLIPGAAYKVDVLYHSKSAGENWNVTADFNPILNDLDGSVSGFTGTVLSGKTYGFTSATYRGVNVQPGIQTGNAASGILEMTGAVGIKAADSNGQLKVYVDDISNVSEVNPGRAWYDGLLFEEFHGLTLRVNTATGATTILNNDSNSFDINYYEVRSASGSLDLGGWTSVDGSVPATSTTWEKAGGSTNSLISETNLFGGASLSPGNSLPIGQAYAGSSPAAQDLEFYYGLPDGSLAIGLVEYISASIPGDYNSDGRVDAADYTVWRDGNSPDSSQAGYNLWKNNYGSTGSSESNATSVPEPVTQSLVLATGAVATLIRRRF